MDIRITEMDDDYVGHKNRLSARAVNNDLSLLFWQVFHEGMANQPEQINPLGAVAQKRNLNKAALTFFHRLRYGHIKRDLTTHAVAKRE